MGIPVDSIPRELIDAILSYLRRPTDIAACLLVSRSFARSAAEAQQHLHLEGPAQSRRLIAHLRAGDKKLAERVRTLDFGLQECVWGDRFIEDALLSLASVLTNVNRLNVSGAQFSDVAFADAIAHLPNLRELDVSYSSIKTLGLSSVLDVCRPRLSVIDISGIFRFKRNKAETLIKMASSCPKLSTIVARNCPDISEEVADEIRQYNVKFVTKQLNEDLMHSSWASI